MGNIWIIGDVHGCYNTLVALVDKLPKNSRIIFVGDLVDKGKYTKKVLDFVIEKGYETLLGNHEYLMSHYIQKVLVDKNYNSNWYKKFGGTATVDNYKDDVESLHKHLKWIKTLPHYIKIDNYFITHGFGLPYYSRRDDKKFKKSLITNRLDNKKDDWEDFSKYDIVNIFGHTPVDDVVIEDNYIMLDTGCVYGNKLSAINIFTKEVITQKTLFAVDVG
jgi:serine/threonine protein phosphatase 1